MIYKVFLLFGFFSDSDYQDILDNSKGNVQNAANVLQTKILDGFIGSDKVESIDVVNMPYIGSFPSFYKKINFKTNKKNIQLNQKTCIYNVDFNNFFFLKNFFRMFFSFFKFYKILKSKKIDLEDCIFFVYAMHLPFLMSAFFLKKIFPSVKFYVIVPDLPEYMVDRKGFFAIVNKVFSILSYGIVNTLDGVVILTKQMKDKFSSQLSSVVMEGIASNNDFLKLKSSSFEKENFLLYSGTLDNRYGLKILIDSFNELDSGNMTELYICGDGPDKNVILDAISNNSKIRYLGLLPREEVLILQKKAKLLINPRNDMSEFTKYSFPSKTLEYMSSGTAVLMYKLSGMPSEYLQYLYIVENDSSFKEKLINLSNEDMEILIQKGEKARNFVNEFKNPIYQINRIIGSIE